MPGRPLKCKRCTVPAARRQYQSAAKRLFPIARQAGRAGCCIGSVYAGADKTKQNNCFQRDLNFITALGGEKSGLPLMRFRRGKRWSNSGFRFSYEQASVSVIVLQ